MSLKFRSLIFLFLLVILFIIPSSSALLSGWSASSYTFTPVGLLNSGGYSSSSLDWNFPNASYVSPNGTIVVTGASGISDDSYSVGWPNYIPSSQLGSSGSWMGSNDGWGSGGPVISGGVFTSASGSWSGSGSSVTINTQWYYNQYHPIYPYYLETRSGSGDRVWRVGGTPPQPVASINVSPFIGSAPLNVQVTDQSSNENGASNLSILLDYGDGYRQTWLNTVLNTVPNPIPLHTYLTQGLYNVTLFITSGTPAVYSNATVRVNVTQNSTLPMATASFHVMDYYNFTPLSGISVQVPLAYGNTNLTTNASGYTTNFTAPLTSNLNWVIPAQQNFYGQGGLVNFANLVSQNVYLQATNSSQSLKNTPISIQVVDSVLGNSIPNETVTVSTNPSQSGITSSNGIVLFSVPPNQIYGVNISANSLYSAQTGSISVGSFSNVTQSYTFSVDQNAILAGNYTHVQAYVYDSMNSTPISGIQLTSPDSITNPQSLWTLPTGYSAGTWLEPSSFTIQFTGNSAYQAASIQANGFGGSGIQTVYIPLDPVYSAKSIPVVTLAIPTYNWAAPTGTIPPNGSISPPSQWPVISPINNTLPALPADVNSTVIQYVVCQGPYANAFYCEIIQYTNSWITWFNAFIMFFVNLVCLPFIFIEALWGYTFGLNSSIMSGWTSIGAIQVYVFGQIIAALPPKMQNVITLCMTFDIMRQLINAWDWVN